MSINVVSLSLYFYIGVSPIKLDMDSTHNLKMDMDGLMLVCKVLVDVAFCTLTNDISIFGWIHWSWVIHMCVSEFRITHHWFRWWLVAWLVSSHYQNQCWNIVTCHSNLRNKLQWNFERSSYIFIQENAFENVIWKTAAILSCPQCVEVLSMYHSMSYWQTYTQHLTHWGKDKMADISQTFSNVFSWMKIYEFRLTFHWSLFLRVKATIFHHWFR